MENFRPRPQTPRARKADSHAWKDKKPNEYEQSHFGADPGAGRRALHADGLLLRAGARHERIHRACADAGAGQETAGGSGQTRPTTNGQAENSLTVALTEPVATLDPPKGCRFRGRCPYADKRCEEEPQWHAVEDNHFVKCRLFD